MENFIILAVIGFAVYILYKGITSLFESANKKSTLKKKPKQEKSFDVNKYSIYSVPEASNSDNSNRYYVIGPPKSGKSVFFVAMADRLQRMFIEKQDKAPYIATYTTRETEQFVTHSIQKMKNQEWPSKTQRGNTYEMNIERKSTFPMSEGKLVFHDYPGEAFMRAFADPKRQEETSIYAEDAKRMREEMKTAKGIFLVLDSRVLHDQILDEYGERLFYLARYLREKNNTTKLAVIFSKSDLFREEPFNPEEKFKQDYLDAFLNFFQLKARYFYVTAAKGSLSKGGIYVPPNNYDTSQTDGVIEAVVWMLDIEDGFLGNLND